VNDYRDEKSFLKKIWSIITICKNIHLNFDLIDFFVINDNYYALVAPFIKFRNRKAIIKYWIRDTPDTLRERMKMSIFANFCSNVYYLNVCVKYRTKLLTLKNNSIICPTKFIVPRLSLAEEDIKFKYNQRKVSYIAAFNSKKGQLELIKNLNFYSAFLKSVTFDFYGDQRTDYFKECYEMAAKSDLNINFKNIVDDVSEIFAESTILLLASKNEGMPRVIYEGLSHFTPFVSFDVCGVKDSFTNGKVGIIVRQGDYLGLIKGILILLNDSRYYFEAINSIKQTILENDYFIKEN
jgi:glycosyltransferase involved in cell wall biosynthesis